MDNTQSNQEFMQSETTQVNHPENPSVNLDNVPSNPDEVRESFQSAHKREEETVGNWKEGFKDSIDRAPIPTPPSYVTSRQTGAHEVKSRLQWGEPGLTILDIRDRQVFDNCAIQGAQNMPLDTLPDAALSSMDLNRDIYIYGDDEQQASSAADLLRSAGFNNVSVIKGGLNAWQEIGGAVDGTDTDLEPGADAYNVVSRLKEFAEERAREKTVG